MSLATRADKIASTGTNQQVNDTRSIEYEPPPKEAVLLVVDKVRERLSEVPERVSMNDEQLRVLVESHISTVMSQSVENHSREDVARIRASAIDELLGFGPLQDLLDDPNISEIMVNGLDKIFVETKGTIQISNRKFDTIEQLTRVIDRMVRTSGRRVDQSSPIVDARLPDGSRLNVVLPPLAIDGPSITIRKFTSDKFFPVQHTLVPVQLLFNSKNRNRM